MEEENVKFNYLLFWRFLMFALGFRSLKEDETSIKTLETKEK